MQDEINEKTIVLAIKGAKISGRVLAMAMREYLRHKHNKPTELKSGKHSLKELMKHGGSYSSVEISKKNIKSFDKVAKKLKIMYGIEKDKTQDPPTYYVFFQSNNKDAFEYAFREYTAKVLKHKEKPSIRQKLKNFREQIKNERTADRDKHRSRDIER